MKIVLSIGILAFLAGPALAAETVVLSSVGPLEVSGTVLELRSWDPATRTIVLVGDSGRGQALRVDDRALAAISRLAPGDKLLVSYRFNKNAEAEVILRGIPVSGVRVIVVSSEAKAGTLTIRGEGGEVRSLRVDADMTDALQGLRPGDRLLVDVDADRLVGIVRSR